MLGSVFDWYSSNTKIDYPFDGRQSDLLHELFVDALVLHNQEPSATRLRVQELNAALVGPVWTAGDVELRYEGSSETFMRLLASEAKPTRTIGDFIVFEWQRTTTILSSSTPPAEYTGDVFIVRFVLVKNRMAGFFASPALYPAGGCLLPRLVDTLIKRVQRIGVALPGADCCQGFSTGKVIFEAGYNMSLAQDAVQSSAGLGILPAATTRVPQRLRFDAVPGAGIGKYNACAEPPLRTINGQGGGDQGDFYLHGKDCTWVEQRVQTAEFFTLNSYTIIAMYPAKLQLHQNCKACCSCADYVDSYRSISRIWDRWKALIARIETLHAQYDALVAYLMENPCKASGIVLLVKMIPRPDFGIDIGTMLINNSQEFASNISLGFALQPVGYVLVAHSGILDRSGEQVTRVDPSAVFNLELPELPNGSYVKYSFSVRYGPALVQRVNTLVSLRAAASMYVSPSKGWHAGTPIIVQAYDKAALVGPLVKA